MLEYIFTKNKFKVNIYNMVDDKNATGAPSVKTPEELKLIVNEIEKEVATEVETDLVQQNQGETEPAELTEEEKVKIKANEDKANVVKTNAKNINAKPLKTAGSKVATQGVRKTGVA